MLHLFQYWARQSIIFHFQMFKQSAFDKFMSCVWNHFFKKYMQMLDYSRCHGGVNKHSSCQTKQQNAFSSVTAASCQPPWRGHRWLTQCPPLQAQHSARPHRVQQWWAPLLLRMWPVWLWLPWLWVAPPQAAPHSTFPLASSVHPDRSTTTVSHKSTTLLFVSYLDLASHWKKM